MEARLPRLILLGANKTDGADGVLFRGDNNLLANFLTIIRG